MQLNDNNCRILNLMTRIFLIIFAFNALFTPASALGVCEMMDESNMTMSLAMSVTISEMDCEMTVETACLSMQCMSDCDTTAAPLLLVSEERTLLFTSNHNNPLVNVPHYYQVILPVSTPPPLV